MHQESENISMQNFVHMIFTAPLFITARVRNLKVHPMDMVYIYTTKYYPTEKKCSSKTQWAEAVGKCVQGLPKLHGK